MEKNETTCECKKRQKNSAAESDVVFIDLKRDFAFKWAFETLSYRKNFPKKVLINYLKYVALRI